MARLGRLDRLRLGVRIYYSNIAHSFDSRKPTTKELAFLAKTHRVHTHELDRVVESYKKETGGSKDANNN